MSTQAPNDGFGFPRRHRLTRSLDIQTVIREGKRIRTAYLDVRVLASPLAVSRIGIIVPRHQQSAVDRNTLKRRLKELVRVELLPFARAALAADVTIRARRETYDATFEQLHEDITSIRDRAASIAPRGEGR